jgi:hypothetical protein
MKPVLDVTYYQRPYGTKIQIMMSNVDEEEIIFFENNNINVSMEDIGNDFAVYACLASDLSEESEILVFANGRSCEETMKDLRVKCEKEFL